MEKFSIGFWHPVGPHGKENLEEIIDRKKKEIRKNGWTLWSFQHRKEESLVSWVNEIKQNIKGNSKVFVLCSEGKNAKAPISDCSFAKQFYKDGKWYKIPNKIKIPHPFGDGEFAYAFKVMSILTPEDIELPRYIKWFKSTTKEWKYGPNPTKGGLPTQGEYLIKSGGKSKLRGISKVLELTYPYVVVIKK